jgi:sortase A
MGARQPAPPAAAEAAYVASAAATGPLDDEPQAPAAGAATGSGVGAHAAPKGKAQPQWRSVSPQAGAPTNRRKRRLGAAIIGVIGELLITVGCLLGLYVAWELGWTTIEARAYVDQVIKTEIITQDDWIVPASAPGSAFLEKRTDEPAAACLPPETPGFGEPWGIMHVPQWGYNYQVPVVEGIDRVEILNKGFIGHYPDTQRPGEIGNFATSAHRTTYGAPYNKAADLQEGDLLIMETANCYFVYEVTGYEIVYPHDVRVIWPVPNEAEATPTKRIITLTTCHPMYSAKQRYIVWGEMSYWSLKEKGAGPLEDLTPPAQRAQYEQEG